jgi:hypothetical protein
MKRILRALKILEVSAVDKPAQEHARVLIMKGKNAMAGKTLDELIQEHAAIPPDIRKGDATDYEIGKAVEKMVDDGLLDTVEKHNYHDLIKMRAAEIRAAGESDAQAYTRTITDDAAGRILFREMKLAKGTEVKLAPEPEPEKPTFIGPAHAKLHAMAIDNQRAHNTSYALPMLMFIAGEKTRR